MEQVKDWKYSIVYRKATKNGMYGFTVTANSDIKDEAIREANEILLNAECNALQVHDTVFGDVPGFGEPIDEASLDQEEAKQDQEHTEYKELLEIVREWATARNTARKKTKKTA